MVLELGRWRRLRPFNFVSQRKKRGGVGWQRILFLEVVKEVGPPGRGGVRRSREGKGGGGVLGKDEEEKELVCWRRYYGFFSINYNLVPILFYNSLRGPLA